ncbi:MAG: autotransporter assembly complex family protein [Pseudomonadota bacterium]
MANRDLHPDGEPFHNITSVFCRIIFLFLTFLLFLPSVVPASVKIEVTVTGVSGPVYQNVLARLTILLQKDNERLQAGAIRRLHRQAEEDIRSALAPFGYYNPSIKSSLEKKGEVWHAEYAIDQGPPIVITEIDVGLVGAGANNEHLVAALADFPLKKGDVLNQELYEKGKKKLVNLAFGEGFLAAFFSGRSLRVNAEANSGSVRLVLDTGRQYLFGTTHSSQGILKQDLLNRYLPYKVGDPYSPAKLFELQSILYQTNYFSKVVARGQLGRVQDFAVPVEIDLTAPEHLNKYSFGLGYATDTGVRGKIDWDNRLFNSSGHKVNSSLQLGERENTIALNYLLPLEDPKYYSLANSLAYQDKQWENTTTQLFTASVAREYVGQRFKLSTGLELRDEIYDVGDTSGDSTLLLPALNIGGIFADDILNTKNGLQASLGLLGGAKGVVSDVTFLQATFGGKAIVSPFEDWRLIGRGSLGATLVDSIDSLPPSLRFYTGGDNTLRGYRYRSIGTRDASGAIIGGKYLVVCSIEVERVIYNQWSLASFWDIGTATDDLSLDFHQGIGGGVRFRLPFGQIRLDVASAITEDGNPLRVHLTVGGDL